MEYRVNHRHVHFYKMSHEMDLEHTCFICEKELSSGEVATVLERGIKTYITSSLKRKDNKNNLLEGKSSVRVHEACRTTYNKEERIAAALNALQKSSTSSSRPVRANAFDFKNNCLYCGKDASDKYLKNDNKKPANKRNPVRMIRTLDFKTNVTTRAETRKDEWGREVIQRLVGIINLVAVEGRYHQRCCTKFQNPVESGRTPGRPVDPNTTKIVNFISTYLEEHREECQISLRDIIEKYEGEIPSEETIKNKLKERYGDEIIITSGSKKEPIICFRDIGHGILAEAFYTRKNKNIEEERKRVVREAADILLGDIRSKVYESNNDSAPHEFLKNIESDIPETLRILLDTIILKSKKGDPAPWAKKIIAIAHAIITAARPRSFISSLQVGLSSVLNRKYGSRDLLRLLSSLGVSGTYEEAMLFEADVDEPIDIELNKFSGIELLHGNDQDPAHSGEIKGAGDIGEIGVPGDIGEIGGPGGTAEIGEPGMPMQLELREQPKRKKRRMIE